MTNPYVDPQRVRAALRTIGVRPTKGMGQNFLIDPSPLKQALESAQVGSGDVVIEVGPGLGVLTWELLQVAGRVVCVELDKRLAARLRDEFNQTNLTVLEHDILNVTPTQILTEAGLNPTTPYKMIANIPYAITSPLLRHFLEADNAPQVMVVLMQWEVAERITAKVGDLSILAHAVQLYAEPSILMRVPAGAFLPPPAVDSALVMLRKHEQRAVSTPPTALFKVIRAGFSQARKKLSNSLPNGLAGQGFPKDQVLAAMASVGIDANLRAEAVTLDQWAALTQELGLTR